MILNRIDLFSSGAKTIMHMYSCANFHVLHSYFITSVSYGVTTTNFGPAQLRTVSSTPVSSVGAQFQAEPCDFLSSAWGEVHYPQCAIGSPLGSDLCLSLQYPPTMNFDFGCYTQHLLSANSVLFPSHFQFIVHSVFLRIPFTF